MDDAHSEGVHNRLGPDISWRPATTLPHDGYPSTPTGGRLDGDTLSYKNFHALSPSAAAEVHIVDPQSLSFGNVSDKLLRESFWCVLMGVRGIDQPADV